MDTPAMPDRALWTKDETINWIAFRHATNADLTGRASILEEWWLDSTDLPNGMVHAMRALAGGPPLWAPPPIPPGTPDWYADQLRLAPPGYSELMKRAGRFMDKMGRPAGALADELQEALLAYQDRHEARRAAEVDLTEAILERRIEVVKTPDGPPYNELRQFKWQDQEGTRHYDSSTVYYASPAALTAKAVAECCEITWFMKKNILTIWPAQSAASTDAASPSAQSDPDMMATAPKRGPGRPNARDTSICLFQQRRLSKVPPEETQLAEACAIRAIWPTDGPSKPTAKTVSEHISGLWRPSDKP